MWKKKLYIKDNLTPFSISRSKIDLYFDCNRCFYLDQKFGIKRPHGTPLVINNFVVKHFKNILGEYRKNQTFFPDSLKINKRLVPSNNELLINWNHRWTPVFFR